MCALKLPKGLPPLPPVPAGWGAWEYMGRWVALTPQTSPWGWYSLHSHEWMIDHGDRFPGGVSLHYIRAVKLPAKKQAQKPTRREPRVSRIATIIQRAISGQLTNAMEGAHEVERIIDNAMRKKRHAKAKKPVKKSIWRILGEGEVIREGDEWRDGGNSGTGAWERSDRIGKSVSGLYVGDYRRKVGAK